MDPCGIYFIRLYKMVSETCKSVIWEMLTHIIQPPEEIINVVGKITKESKDVKIPVIHKLKMLLKIWKEDNTTTPVETDFDITSLCKIILFILQKQKSELNCLSTIKAINDLRNALAHAGNFFISDDQYKEKYREIRGHVDDLESVIDRRYRPNFTCKGIRRRSSKYLNQIDRIDKEYIDPDTYMNLRMFINQWRKDLLVLESEENDKEENKEKQKEGEETISVRHVEDFSETTSCELGDNNKIDLYDKDNVEETLQEMKDIIRTVNENKKDLDEQAKRHQREIKALNMSIINIKKKVEHTDTKEKVEADHGLENSDATESLQNLYEREQNLIHEQNREIDEVENSTDLQITAFERQFDEELKSCTDEYEELLTCEKIEKDTKIKREEEHYESLVTKRKSLFERIFPKTENDEFIKTLNQNKRTKIVEKEKQYQVEIEEVEKSTGLQITELERNFDEESKSCSDEYAELLTYEKKERDRKIKQVEEHYESEVTKHKLMFERIFPKTENDDFIKSLDQNKRKEITEIEKQYQVEKEEMEKSTGVQITELERNFDEESKSCSDKYEELLTYKKIKNDRKIKQVEERYEYEVTRHKLMFERFFPEKKYYNIIKTFDQNKRKEITEIEKQYQVEKAELDGKLKDKISNYRKNFEEKKEKAELERDNIISKIKQKIKSF